MTDRQLLRLAEGERVALVAVDGDGWADVIVVVDAGGHGAERRGEVPVAYLTRLLEPAESADRSSAVAALSASSEPELAPGGAAAAPIPIPTPCRPPPQPPSPHVGAETAAAAPPPRVPIGDARVAGQEGVATAAAGHPAGAAPAGASAVTTADAEGSAPAAEPRRAADPLGRKPPW